MKRTLLLALVLPATAVLPVLAQPAPPAAKPAPPAAATAKPSAPGTKASPSPLVSTPPAAEGAHPAGLTLGGGATVEALNIHLNRSGDFEIPGHVKFTEPGTDVVGDSAHGNQKNKTAIFHGNVVLHNSKPVGTFGFASSKAQNAEPQTLTCDELQIDAAAKVYVAIGHVHFTQGTRVMTADRGTLNQGAHILDVQGNVHMDDSATGEGLIADAVHYDTLTEDVSISGKEGQPAILRGPGGSPEPEPSAAPKKKKRG